MVFIRVPSDCRRVKLNFRNCLPEAANVRRPETGEKYGGRKRECRPAAAVRRRRDSGGVGGARRGRGERTNRSQKESERGKLFRRRTSLTIRVGSFQCHRVVVGYRASGRSATRRATTSGRRWLEWPLPLPLVLAYNYYADNTIQVHFDIVIGYCRSAALTRCIINNRVSRLGKKCKKKK